LTARGEDDLLIDTIAESMLQWTHLQGVLEEQLSQARTFVSEYQTFAETRQLRNTLNEIIDTFEQDVSGQIDKLEQAIRDLLQIVSDYRAGKRVIHLSPLTTYFLGICMGFDQ
jgi:hypothetical protein